ncbi:MAG TPA: hypothetical protein VFT55_10210 [Planctomycetota bacterium]|nr:hypothetical protein [Planctomycetota bacterium]
MTPHPIPRLLLLASVTGGLAAQNVTLPDYHYLMENPTQLGSVGSTAWWPGALTSRFQILYEASHFLSAGVTGQVLITKIKFRGEDGEKNLGGQSYAGVLVELGSTNLAAAALTDTFATNRAPALPSTTTMGLPGTTTVNVAASAGSIPNNWNIELDLLAMGNPFPYDPTGAEPNLLIDIDMPNAPSNPAPLGMIPISNTTGTAAQIRGNGCTSAGLGATMGALNPNPPIVGVEFVAGPGGYATVIPATNEFYGGACGGSAVSFYEAFLNGQAFDLGAGLTLTPDNPTTPNYYTVTAGAPAPDTTQVNLTANQTADDGVYSHPLGFTFNYPTGSTSTIVASTNGFVWLDPAQTESAFAAVVSRFLGDPAGPAALYSGARLAIMWKDLNMQRNATINPLAGLHVLTNTSGGPGNAVCYVTWWDIGEFNVVGGVAAGHTQWTFQMVLFEATGVVQYRYGNVPQYATASTVTAGCNSTIVGFSPGRIGGATGTNAVDPQSRDLSLEVPFATRPEGALGNIGQRAVATPNAGGVQYGGRMYAGQTLRWNAVNVPPSTILGAQLLDVGSIRPGLQFPGITAPGCMLSTTAGALLWEVFVLPSGTATGTVPLVVPPGFLGVEIYAQFVVLDGLFGGPYLITASSNAVKHIIGLN